MPRPSVPILSVETIVEAAVDLGGETGQFTLRDVATRLGVKQASLYNHIPSKGALLQLMRDHIHEGMAVKLDVNSSWQDALRVIARGHRAFLVRHPWLISELAEAPAALGAAITSVENLATVLENAGFCPYDVRQAIGAIDIVVIGGSIDWFAPAQLFPQHVLDNKSALARAIKADPADAHRANSVFEFTLNLLIHSLASRLVADGASRPGRRRSPDFSEAADRRLL